MIPSTAPRITARQVNSARLSASGTNGLNGEAAAALVPGWQPGGAKRFFLDESAKYAMLRPPTPGYPYLTTTFAKAAQDIIAGGNPKQILDQAASDIDADLKANNYYGY